MQRRVFLVGALGVGGLGGNGPARALGGTAAVLLAPDGRAVQLRRFTPAAGPLQRHAARPGAWYALLYLPMAPQWPLQLLLWSTERGHDLRLFALDAALDDDPTVVYPLPLDTEASRAGRPPRRSSRFMLPAASTAPAIFVLVEQWRIDGQPPAPLWVQLLAHRGPAATSAPWWASRVSPASSQADGALPPPSPLTQQARDTRAHEVPILSLPAAPESGVWR